MTTDAATLPAYSSETSDYGQPPGVPTITSGNSAAMGTQQAPLGAPLQFQSGAPPVLAQVQLPNGQVVQLPIDPATGQIALDGTAQQQFQTQVNSQNSSNAQTIVMQTPDGQLVEVPVDPGTGQLPAGFDPSMLQQQGAAQGQSGSDPYANVFATEPQSYEAPFINPGVAVDNLVTQGHTGGQQIFDAAGLTSLAGQLKAEGNAAIAYGTKLLKLAPQSKDSAKDKLEGEHYIRGGNKLLEQAGNAAAGKPVTGIEDIKPFQQARRAAVGDVVGGTGTVLGALAGVMPPKQGVLLSQVGSALAYGGSGFSNFNKPGNDLAGIGDAAGLLGVLHGNGSKTGAQLQQVGGVLTHANTVKNALPRGNSLGVTQGVAGIGSMLVEGKTGQVLGAVSQGASVASSATSQVASGAISAGAGLAGGIVGGAGILGQFMGKTGKKISDVASVLSPLLLGNPVMAGVALLGKIFGGIFGKKPRGKYESNQQFQVQGKSADPKDVQQFNLHRSKKNDLSVKAMTPDGKEAGQVQKIKLPGYFEKKDQSGQDKLADLNGDAIPDLVWQEKNKITVRLGLGGGKFGDPKINAEVDKRIEAMNKYIADHPVSADKGKRKERDSWFAGLMQAVNDPALGEGRITDEKKLREVLGDKGVDKLKSKLSERLEELRSRPVSEQVLNVQINKQKPNQIQFGDADGDGKTDLVVLGGDNAAPGQHVFKGKGDGTFETEEAKPAGAAAEPPPAASPGRAEPGT